jgi:hypothetical protein
MREERHLEFRHDLSVCAIAKNEGCYFQEWIEFHRLVGVEKFYIYDNESSDDTRKILEPYIEAGVVEYTWFPGDKRQLPAYKDCVRRHKYDTRWFAFIDLDEFVVPLETKTIPEFLQSLPADVSQLVIAWVLYGSSGYKTKPDGLVIENYTYRAVDNFLMGSVTCMKVIVNPRFLIIDEIYGPHVQPTIGKTIDENLRDVGLRGSLKEDLLPRSKIRINHYWVKSYEECVARMGRGDAIFGKNARTQFSPDDFLRRDKNDIFDNTMNKYVVLLRNALHTS